MIDRNTEARYASAKGRLNGFLIHLFAYFLVMAGLVGANLSINPTYAWSLFPVVAWGSVLAVHAAYVMGLLDGLFRSSGR